ncbi:MAG TPA: type II toxin-antitoxin system prevent-host-death family antitoxin [Acidimicrobiales bacterium]
MTEITIRELRSHGNEMIDRVAHGERMTVIRDGRPVAQLLPLERQPLSIQAIQRRWLKLPPMDPDSLGRDIDANVDQKL